VHTGGSYRVDPENLPTHVAITLRRDQYADIQNRVNAGEAVELEFDIQQNFVPGPIPLYNVIAEIPGTDKAAEMVIFGGHLDSWDGARGTQDNGTGTSTTLEAARILAATLREQGLQPRRTIRFMLWSGEEQGLLGSRAYAQQHPEELPLIGSVIVHDGGTNACSGIQASPHMKPMLEEVFAPMIAHTANAEDEVLRFRIVDVEGLPRGVGSDHDTYLGLGVPGFFWNQRGNTSYGYIHHTQHDLYEEARADYQLFTARIVASAAWRLANAETMVPRTDLPGDSEGRRPRRRMGFQPGEDGSVQAVTDGGMAAKAGLKAGDKLLKIGDREVKDMQSLFEALNAADNRAMIIWQRGSERMAAWFDWEKETVEASKAPN
ncbi:MAG: M20/M25/M40 family metallo-hydrolase, partial [Planctomycetota bacterium]|nr:M20/M25/M40 family metallo-hydrolase [Planctomycetota bacterium]